jgi:hypothetical protein
LNHFPSAAEASLTRTQLAGMFLLLSFWSLKNWSCDPLSHILRGWYSSSKYSVHRCIVQGNTSQWWKKFTKHDNLHTSKRGKSQWWAGLRTQCHLYHAKERTNLELHVSLVQPEMVLRLRF